MNSVDPPPSQEPNAFPPNASARRWMVVGQVQGVGYRPFVYRLAHGLSLTGWVRNLAGRVEILAQGTPDALLRFGAALEREGPAIAKPRVIACDVVAPEALDGFSIIASTAGDGPDVHVPPDYFACDDCLRELRDPGNRRYRYPFINCTQCGPRYTLITRLPYDRPHTTMAGFPMCPDCRREYHDPLDRRFHAEPIACPVCGPQLIFRSSDGQVRADRDEAYAACVQALANGSVVAVKGVGGYHLMCDGTNEEAVGRLRLRKQRPDKPLAVMYPVQDGLALLRRDVELGAEEEALLRNPARPILLLPKSASCSLPDSIAPGLAEVGVMLPYTPLHDMLLQDLARPVVATSANISGEPVLTDGAEVENRLGRVVDAFLHHDRPIQRPADDPVFRVIAGKARPLRLGRGCAPLELVLPTELPEPVLAVGGHMKNTVALGWGNRVVISPHIGDLDSLNSLATFEQVITDMQELYQVRARRVVCDAHPGYGSAKWAAKCGLPSMPVLHHHAHAAAVAGEYPDVERWLVFTWDGVGLGAEGNLWGGEGLLGAPGAWQRVATLRRFRLPGGERAGREPWRSAAALCWETGALWPGEVPDVELLRQAWERGINSPQTSAAGRLFDAAADLLGLVSHASFEGQGPMAVEACAETGVVPVALPVRQVSGQLVELDWAPLVGMLLDAGRSVSERAGCFHASMAEGIVRQAGVLRDRHGAFTIGLAGGVFQNRLLAEAAITRLREEGFRVCLPERVPYNDAGISFGQTVEAAARS